MSIPEEFQYNPNDESYFYALKDTIIIPQLRTSSNNNILSLIVECNSRAVMNELEDFIKMTVIDKSKEWFGRKMSEESFNRVYRKICPDNILYVSKTTENCNNVFDRSNNRIEFDEIPNNSILECVLNIEGLKFKEDFFCVIYSVVGIKIKSNFGDVPFCMF